MASPPRPLNDLQRGSRIWGTVVSHQPWGMIVQLHDFRDIGASLDTVRRGTEAAVRRLAEEPPPPGTTMEFIIADVRRWHRAPGVWVDLTASH